MRYLRQRCLGSFGDELFETSSVGNTSKTAWLLHDRPRNGRAVTADGRRIDADAARMRKPQDVYTPQ